MDLRTEVKRMMRRVRNGRLPGSEIIVDTAFEELGYGPIPPDPGIIRKEFNDRLREVFEYTLEVLERFEEDAYIGRVPEELFANKPEAFQKAEMIIKDSCDMSSGLRDAFRSLFADLYPTLRRIFLSINQSRKTRGGKDFELQFGKLLEYAAIPYQKVSQQTRTDFMVPSDEVFNTNPNIALVLSLKRTLRERWREVAEELFNLRSPNVYLLTADERITRGHVDQICGQYRIRLVVWDEIKVNTFQDDPLVIGYSDMANDVFPTFEQRWSE